MCLHHLIVPSVLRTAGTIMMGRRGIFLKVGILKCRFRSGNRVSVSCIQWRILRFLRNCLPWSWHSMDRDQLELVLRFLGLMTSISANSLKNRKISGEVDMSWHWGILLLLRETCGLQLRRFLLRNLIKEFQKDFK
uniref:Uncharacterized protein n=1 Tax=Salix viminalis TaxID=40686 RepID=A0A6N2NF59_SALVM